jgi:prepilin-type N-terminal cleavage/methylation domain-containing protein
MRKGFSLIEIVIAVGILALIVGGMLEIFQQGFGAAKKSQDRTIAYSLAREKLEEKSSVLPWPPAGEPRALVSGFSGVEREVVVVSPYLGYNDLALISVTVWWDNGNQSQTFVTLKANY